MDEIERKNGVYLQKVDEYHAAKAAKIEKAMAYRDARVAEFDAAEAQADEDRDKELAQIEELKASEADEHAKLIERIQAENEAQKAAD